MKRKQLNYLTSSEIVFALAHHLVNKKNVKFKISLLASLPSSHTSFMTHLKIANNLSLTPIFQSFYFICTIHHHRHLNDSDKLSN